MIAPTPPEPDRSDPATAAYWRALDSGSLIFQRCLDCNASWLPPQPECPNCLADQYRWERASGRGRIVASTVFHRAYHPAFADRIPYSVSLVELEEGPRLLSNVVGLEGLDFDRDAAVELAIERRDGLALARFRRI